MTHEVLLTLSASILLAAAPPTLAQQAAEPSSASTSAAASSVIATVNGEPIHFEDLERLLGEMHRGAAAARRQAPDLERALFRLVNDKILAQEARALGMHTEEPIPARLAAKRESLAVTRLEWEEVWSRSEPSEQELQQGFREAYQSLTFHILTVRERDVAAGLLARLSDGADFEALAREHSIDPYGPRGGLVEKLPKIDMPRELAEQVFVLEPGTLQGPVTTRIGWSVIRVESRTEADPARFEALRSSVRDLVRLRKAEQLRRELAPRLREAYVVVVEEPVLAAIVPEKLPDGRLVPKLADPDAVVARVGERAIDAAALGKALRARWRGVANAEAALAAKPLVLERMIREELMLSEAVARGYGKTPEAERALSAYETELLVPRFLNDVVAAGITVSQEEMRAYYAQHKESFHKPPRLQLRQLTVADEAQARRLAELLKQGAEFAWLARQHSTDAFKDAGGDRGWVVAGSAGELLKDALFEARPGDVLGPVAVADEFLIAQVGAREEQGIYAFDEISGNVRKTLREQKLQQALHNFIQTARSRSRIEVHEDVLASLHIRGTHAEQAPHPELQP